MQLNYARVVFGTALLLLARLGTAQTETYSLKVERSDARPGAFVQEAPRFDYQPSNESDDPSAKPQIAQRMRVLVSRNGVGEAMGMSVTPVPPALAAQLRLRPLWSGLVVEGVAPGSAADRAGIQQYDVIERVDDQVVTSPQQFQKIVAGHHLGEEASMAVIREGKRKTLSVAAPAQSEPRRLTQRFNFAPQVMKLPPNAFEFSPEQKQKLGEMSNRVQEEVQKQERQIEELTAKIRAEAEDAKKQIQQLKEEIRREAQQEKEQVLKKLKESRDQADDKREEQRGF